MTETFAGTNLTNFKGVLLLAADNEISLIFSVGAVVGTTTIKFCNGTDSTTVVMVGSGSYTTSIGTSVPTPEEVLVEVSDRF